MALETIINIYLIHIILKMGQELPEKALRELHLDERTEVFWSAERGRFVSDTGDVGDLTFLGVGLIAVHYFTRVELSDDDLCESDPYTVVRQGYRSASTNGSIPHEATHYCLGPTVWVEKVSSDERKFGSSADHFSIAYMKIARKPLILVNGRMV